MANIFDMADEWNDSGTTFTAIKMDVTDTASASGSLLMDLQVGGSSLFAFRKDGNIALGSSSTTFFEGASPILKMDASGSVVRDGWGLSTSGLVADVFILRDASNTLAQRNSTNAQTFNIYNTYTDASNYERGFVRWVANTFEIGTDSSGAGSNRDILISPASDRTIFGAAKEFAFHSSTFRITKSNTISWSSLDNNVNSGFDDLFLERSSAGIMSINGNGSGAAIQMTEMTAPSAGASNTARLYVDDNGAGKSRLMVVFASGAAQQIAIEP